MAIDLKYGRVTLENGDIGEDEPVIVFRAKDKLLPSLLAKYAAMASINGSPPRHVDLIVKSRQRIIDWQREHGSRTPTSESSRNWLDQ